MADNTKVATTPKVISIDVSKLPKGFNVDKLAETLTRYEERNQRSLKYNEGRRKALADLAAKYPVEYKALLKKYNPNQDGK